MQEANPYYINLPKELSIYQYKWVLGEFQRMLRMFSDCGLFPCFCYQAMLGAALIPPAALSGIKIFFI